MPDFPGAKGRPAILGACLLLAASVANAQDKPLASTTSAEGDVRIDITSLKRTEGETLTLRFQVTNNSTDTFRVVAENIKLIDIVGRRMYSPGVTGSGCSTPVQKRSSCYAIFGAPPATTKTISIQFYEKIDLIGGVPIDER